MVQLRYPTHFNLSLVWYKRTKPNVNHSFIELIVYYF